MRSAQSSRGRLTARPPREPVPGDPAPRLERLDTSNGREALLYVPARLDAPAPFAVLLHGAGSNARDALLILQDRADDAGLVLLAPASASYTWDVIASRYGPDVAAIDGALEHVFATLPVDPERLAVGGFSDGASYALSLGIANGDVFSHVLAFSPGFAAPAVAHGTPRVLITHGTEDGVLPIERCGRRLARELTGGGYDVRYEEFEGGHVVPPELADAAVAWLAGGGG